MSTDSMRVQPTRTEGLPAVTEIIFYPDRMSVCSAGEWLAIPFAPLVRWSRPAGIWKALGWFGYRLPGRIIADRNWVDTATESLFVFYTKPLFKVWLPYEADYMTSSYFQLQQFLREGGYNTCDIG